MGISGQVKDATFFHNCVNAERQHEFDKNLPIHIEEDKFNPRYKELLNFKPTPKVRGNEMGFLKYLDYLVDNGRELGAPHNWTSLLDNITNIAYRINNRYYERIFEEIRQNEFSNLPSRYSCIYLSDKDHIEIWHEHALKQNKVNVMPIYEFKATGKVHEADAEWLEVDIVSDDEYKMTARKYWNGEKQPNSSLIEILFCGELQVVKKYNNIDDYKAVRDSNS